MLHRLSANKPEFKPITFVQGLNLIVAERAPDASDQDSRNARGKTSLLYAINYCLGGGRPEEFKPLGEAGWRFTLEMDLFGDRVVVSRDVKGGSRVEVLTRSNDGTADAVLADYRREDNTVSLDDWKFLLGLGLFGLDDRDEDGGQGISPRTLISYVIRFDPTKDPTKFFAAQPASSSRQHIAFLLGLDWRHTRDLARMKKDEDTFKAFDYASEAKLMPGIVNDEAELLIQRGELERELQEATRQADSFELLQDPQGTLEQANTVAAELTRLTDEQVVADRLIRLYRESVEEVAGDQPNGEVVGEVYRELGLVFSGAALRRFDQVEEFHRSLAGNRRRFMESEVNRLETESRDREPKIRTLQARRQGLLRQLASGGGLDDLLELQRRVSDVAARIDSVDEAIAAVRNVSASRDALGVRQATSKRDARQDLDQNRQFVDSVNHRFSELLRELYNRSASVTVTIDSLGYKFAIKVSGASSTGITKMQLFSFDLTLMELSRTNRHPHFLAHDSTVFSDVDPRQITTALNIARRTATAMEAQYIVTMNTNEVPDAISSADWYEDSVRRIILDTEVGGAFGVVF